MRGSEDSDRYLPAIGFQVSMTLIGYPRCGKTLIEVSEEPSISGTAHLPSVGHEDLLQLHDGGISAQSLVYGVVLPRVTGIEMLCVGIMVAHDVEPKRIVGSISLAQAIDYLLKL